MVSPSGDQGLAVPRKGDRGHPVLLPLELAHLLERGYLPEVNGGIPSGRGQELAISGKGETGDAVAVPRQGALYPSGGRVPKTDFLPTTPCGQDFAIGRKGHRVGPVQAELTKFLSGADLPEPDRAVIAGRSQRPAVRGERNRHDALLMSRELAKGPERVRVPQADRVVRRARGQGATIRGKAERMNPARALGLGELLP